MKITDCPHRPGTPEHNAWVNTVYIPWQRCDPETVNRAEANHAAAQQMWRDMEHANPERVAADAVMREVEEATRPAQPMLGILPFMSGSSGLFGSFVKVDASQYLDSVKRMQDYIDELAKSWTMSVPLVQFDTLYPAAFRAVPAPVTPRHAKGRKRRTPAPPAARCHHGNPRNACRDCSMGRR